ncbi:hypothetical protein L0F63_002369 [Massospora cicadina]|nr:hypothetical protein L0F63_002369 [Massospora cicadina]
MPKRKLSVSAAAAFHTMRPLEVAALLDTNLATGLTSLEVQARIKTHGNNTLRPVRGRNPMLMALGHILNIPVAILAIALVIVIIFDRVYEYLMIGSLMAANAVIGFLQEFCADRTMVSVQQLSAPSTTVMRDGQLVRVPTVQLVQGDLVLLETGDIVGADMRLVEQYNLAIDEALLTGEPTPVEKVVEAIHSMEASIGDRINYAFSSTTVVRGRGRGIVVATGMNTEIGAVANSLSCARSRKTNLSKTLERMLLVMFSVAVALTLVVFTALEWDIKPQAALYVAALSIAIIPEGLTAVIAITMASGAKRMVQLNAIVRRLNALEVLGSVTNICSDKTGTLTQAKMVLTRLWLPGDGYYSATGAGYAPEGVILYEGEVADDSLTRRYLEGNAPHAEVAKPDDLTRHMQQLTQAASLCSLGQIRFDELLNTYVGVGDPTENALQAFALKLGLGREVLTDPQGRYQFQLLTEFPFDANLKIMSRVFLHRPTMRCFVYTKGAIEYILPKCTRYLDDGEFAVGGHDHLAALCTPHNDHLASQGLRTLCLAYRELPPAMARARPGAWTREDIEYQLVMVGLVGIRDPPRPESLGSVLECFRAGISVHMLTGDHHGTAVSIAHEVGILPTLAPDETFEDIAHMVMTGAEFDALTENELDALPELPYVVSRCSPDTKVKMIHALHRRGCIVAMTGDGANDSPALKIADVGIGIGQFGSDIAKQAADIVLNDDNFSTIIRAVEEGRRIHENIVKFITHLLSVSVGATFTLMLGLRFIDNDRVPTFSLSPIQILCLSILALAPAAVGLGLEPVHPKTLLKPPRNVRGGLFTCEVIFDIFFYGLLIGGLSLFNFFMVARYFADRWGLFTQCNEGYSEKCLNVFQARGAAYACITLLALLHAFNCISARRPAWSINGLRHISNNPTLVGSFFYGAALLIPAFYVRPVAHTIFHHAPFKLPILGQIGGSCVTFITLSELYKALKRCFLAPDRIFLDDFESFPIH